MFFVFGDQMMELSVASREAQEKHAEALLRVRTPDSFTHYPVNHVWVGAWCSGAETRGGVVVRESMFGSGAFLES